MVIISLPARIARAHPSAADSNSSIAERVSHREMAGWYGPVTTPDREWREPEVRRCRQPCQSAGQLAARATALTSTIAGTSVRAGL